jgi:hypothetical protein
VTEQRIAGLSALGGEVAQRLRLCLGDDLLRHRRVEILLPQHQSFSTVTLRLV